MPTWLAIDAGNSRVKWGLGRPGHWQASGTLETAHAAALVSALPPLPPGTRAVFCCVAGEATERVVDEACGHLAVPVRQVRSAAAQLGVTNAYLDPGQLGSDRWAALVAAHTDRAANQLVVNAGTALTVDALAADGRFLGGIITAGVQLMQRALVEGTARLRPPAGNITPFPRCTDDAIATGTAMAGAGAVDRMAEAMARAGLAVERVVLSGGGASVLAPQLRQAVHAHPPLVLDGLARIGASLPWPA